MSISLNNHEQRITALENKTSGSSGFTIENQYNASSGTTGLISTPKNMTNFHMISFGFKYRNNGPYMNHLITVEAFKKYGFGYDMRGGENADRGYGASIAYKSDTSVQSASGYMYVYRVDYIKIG